MRKTINKTTIIGRVYEQNLTEKISGDTAKTPGVEFINGTIDIATDEACLNIVQIHFTYVTDTTKKGSKNSTYTALKKIINENKTILTVGKENAMMVKIADSALDLNDFYTNRNGEETLVSAKRNEGGFVTILTSLPEEKERNRFETDMLINGTQYVEADPEKNIDKDYLIVKGAVFNFRNDIKPVEFVVKSEGGIKYFESLDASPKNLTFTKVWGTINSETIVRRVEEESAFGEPSVKEYTRNVREWVITGTSKPDMVYEIGDSENGITESDIKKALADREVYLADVKKRADEWRASQSKTDDELPFGKEGAKLSAAAGGFNF